MLSCKFSKMPTAIRLADSAPVAFFTQEDLEIARREAFQRGHNAAAAEREASLARHEREMIELQRKTLEKLAAGHEALVEEFCGMVPRMVMDGVRRILATVEFDETLIKNIVGEMISEMHPGTADVEVSLNERDLVFFETAEENLQSKYPGIHFCADPDLQQGDCIIRSRFGTLDGTLATKLENLEGVLE